MVVFVLLLSDLFLRSPLLPNIAYAEILNLLLESKFMEYRVLNKLGGVRIYCLFCFLVIVILEKTVFLPSEVGSYSKIQ